MSNQHKCPKCGTSLSTPGEPCTRCLLSLSITNQGKPDLGPGFLDDLPVSSDTKLIADKYRILAVIGRGSFGIVYRARQENLDREVAVKTLRDSVFADNAAKEQFLREAKVIALLTHPNIVGIYDWGEDRGQPFFSMELVDGPSLAQLARNKPLPPAEAARIMRAVAEAIHLVHQRGLLHRDLKPANILLGSNGQPKITDFGLAKRTHGDVSHTLHSSVLGSPGYMSPEQASGIIGAVGTASDIYGLGATLYFLLTGRAPFTAESIPETLRQVVETEPLSPRKLFPTIPSDLEAICLKCLEKSPPRRYASANELAEDLDHFLKNEPIKFRQTPTPESTIKQTLPRTPLTLVVASIILGMGVVCFTAYKYWPFPHAKTQSVSEEVSNEGRTAKNEDPGLEPITHTAKETLTQSTTPQVTTSHPSEPEQKETPNTTLTSKSAQITDINTPVQFSSAAYIISGLLKTGKLNEAHQAYRGYTATQPDEIESNILQVCLQAADIKFFTHDPEALLARIGPASEIQENYKSKDIAQDLRTLIEVHPNWKKPAGDFIFDLLIKRLANLGAREVSLLPSGDDVLISPDPRYTAPPDSQVNGIVLGRLALDQNLSAESRQRITVSTLLIQKKEMFHDFLLASGWRDLLKLAAEFSPTAIRNSDIPAQQAITAFEKAELPSSALLVRKTWLELRGKRAPEVAKETLHGLSNYLSESKSTSPRKLAVLIGYWYESLESPSDLARLEYREPISKAIRTVANRSGSYEAAVLSVHTGLNNLFTPPAQAAPEPSMPYNTNAEVAALLIEADRAGDSMMRQMLVERARKISGARSVAELQRNYKYLEIYQINTPISTTLPRQNPAPQQNSVSGGSPTSNPSGTGEPPRKPSNSFTRPIDKKIAEALEKMGVH